MKHALIHLEEELRKLRADQAKLERTPEEGGTLAEAGRLWAQLDREIGEVAQALEVLRAAMAGVSRAPRRDRLLSQEIAPGRCTRADWDKATFESWADRKARLAAERAGDLA